MTDAKTFDQSLYEALMGEILPQISNTGGKYTVSIVNNVNGKRFTISKSIADHLELSDFVIAKPTVEKRKLVLGRALPFPGSSKVNLSGSGKKIGYNSEFVQMLTKVFNLDFTKRTSRSFSDITFEMLDDVPVAIVSFPEEASEATSEVSSEEAV